MNLRIHAICPALNEEMFITEQLKTLYPFCSGISILSQYDRDWHGNAVEPDRTIQKVINFPDPEGKIHCVVRRWPDETAARNQEMKAIASRPDKGISEEDISIEPVRRFHEPPDYFLIVDADEFYDPDTVGNILGYLDEKRPRGMRVKAYNYKGSWNRRVPRSQASFCHFGFLRTGIMLEHVRVVTWNEQRLSKLLRLLHLPDVASRVFGFITCPMEVGMFHHGCWLGDHERLVFKHRRSGHSWVRDAGHLESVEENITTEFVPTQDLPRNIREGDWPEGFLEDAPVSSSVS